MTRSRRVAFIAASGAVSILIAACGTDDAGTNTEDAYPNGLVTVVVPYAAGGTVDITARILANQIDEHLGQRMVIQNVTGAGGSVGFNEVANADPDGYTVVMGATPMVQHQYLLDDIEYGHDTFEPVTMVTFDPNVLVARTGSDAEVSSVEQVIELTKQRPGEIIMGVGGHWASHDIARAALELETGAQFGRAVLDGGAGVVTALLGDQIDLGFNYVGEFVGQLGGGELTVLAVASDERSPYLEDVPTLQEEGVDLSIGVWRGILAPPGTPDDIVNVLNDAILATTEEQAWQDEMNDALVAPVVQGPDEFAKTLADSDAQAAEIAEKLKKEGNEEANG